MTQLPTTEKASGSRRDSTILPARTHTPEQTDIFLAINDDSEMDLDPHILDSANVDRSVDVNVENATGSLSTGRNNGIPAGNPKKVLSPWRCLTCPLKSFNSDAEVRTHVSHVHGLFYAIAFGVKGIKEPQLVYFARGQAAHSLRCPSCPAVHQSPYTLVTHGRRKHQWTEPTKVTHISSIDFDSACFLGASELHGYFLVGSNNRTTLLGGIDEADDMLLTPTISNSSLGSFPSSPTPILAGTRRSRPLVEPLDDESPPQKRAKVAVGTELLTNQVANIDTIPFSPNAGGSVIDIEPLEDITMAEPSHHSHSPSPSPSPTPTSAKQHEVALNETQTLISHPLLLRFQLRVNKDHRALLCIDPKCLHAIVPSNILYHLTRIHGYEKPSASTIEAIQRIAQDHDVYATESIPIPAVEATPVSGMFLLRDGFQCTAQDCQLGFRSFGSGTHHWNKMHGSTRAEGHLPREEIVPSPVQGFFPDHRGYFPVQLPPSSEPVSVLEAYSSCAQKYSTIMDNLLPPPMNANETPMMEKITHWHQHLSPYIDTRDKLDQVLLLKKPLPLTETSWLGRLRDLILGHMLLVHTFAMGAGLDILVLLKCYASSDKEAFRALSDENTLETYALTILTLLLMCIRSLEPATEDSYRLPLDAKHRKLLSELRSAIETDTDKHKCLHRFLVYALGPDEQAHAASEGEKDWDKIVSRIRKGKGKLQEARSSRGSADEDNDDFDLAGDVPTYALDSHVISEVDSMGKFNSLIDPFFALFHLSTDGKMKPPGLVTQTFAKITYFSRATTLCEGHYSFETLPELTLYKCVEKAAEILLAPLQANAFNKSQNYTRFISSLVHNTARPAACRVSDDGDVIQYGRSSFSVIGLRLELQSSYAKAEGMLQKLCKGSESSWTFPLGIVDDWRESQRGYGLATTGKWLKTPHPLVNAILVDDPTFFGTDEKGDLTLDREKANIFLSDARDLLSLLSILLFIIPGQPPRAAELLDHKLINGQKDRTVFLGPNHNVWVVTRRSKTETQTQREVFVPLVLPERLRWIFLTYILVVRPVEVDLCAILHGAERALVQSEYLFAVEGVRVSRHTFSANIRKWFEGDQAVKDMGTRNCRHIFTEVCRLYVGNQQVEALRGQQDIFAEQQMHAPSTAADIYAVEMDHLSGITSDKLHSSKNACMAWWEVLDVREGFRARIPLKNRRLDSGHSVYTTVLQPEGGTLDPSVVRAIADIVAKQTIDGILPTIQGLFRAQENRLTEKFQLALANSAALQTMATNGLDDMFLPTTTTSNFPSTSLPSTIITVASGSPLTISDGPDSLETLSSTGLTALDFLNRVLKSSTPAFSSISQQKMIEHALAQDSSAVIVLPTGGGKSMLWNVIGMTKDTSFMVVMNHTNSLMEDQKRSTTALGIPCETWSVSMGSAPLQKTKVVYVGLETIISAGFERFYHEHKHRIRGIAIDEAHSVLTDDHRSDSYRKLKRLTDYCTKPRFLLTATLPHVLEDLVIRSAGLLPLSTSVYREPLRQRVRYVVKPRPVAMKDPELASLIDKEATPVLRAKGWKGLIFVKSIDACKKIGALFGNSITHSDLPRLEKIANENAWKEGRTPFLVATSGFICGINMPDVGLVVFVDMPYGLINLVQGAGRAGRSSEVEATVLVIYDPRRLQSPPPMSKEDRTLIRAGNDFVTTIDCRRKVISVNFNFQEDHDRDCIDFQVALNDIEFPPCDNCDSQEPIFPSLIQQLIRAARKDPKPTSKNTTISLAGPSTSVASTSATSNTANTLAAPTNSTRPPPGYYLRAIQDNMPTATPSSSRFRASPTTPTVAFKTALSPPMLAPSSPPSPTSFIPPSSLFTTPIAGPSYHPSVTPLQLANAQQSLGDARKHQVIELVNGILQRFRRKCIVCYLHGRGLLDTEDDLPHHNEIWTTCKRNCGSIQMNQLFQFKKDVNSIFKANGEKYKICYHCLLPQGQFLPDEHRDWVQGSNNPCWFEGIVPIILTFIYNTPSLRNEAVAEPRFAGLSEYLNTHQRFAEYFVVEENVGEHWKGLELVAWYWARYHSQ